MRRYRAGTREGSRAIFSKNLKQTTTHPLPVCSLRCSFTSDPQRTFEALLFAHSLTQK